MFEEMRRTDAMRRTKEDAAITRERLLAAALQCFRTRGYAMTKLEDIAQQAGTTRGAIQWHFGTKADLFNDLVRDRAGRALRSLHEEVYARGGTPLDMLRRLLTWWLRYPQEDADYRAVLELTLLKTEVGPDLIGGFQEKLQRLQEAERAIAEVIEAGIAQGEMRPEVDPAVASRAAMGLIQGVTSRWLLEPSAPSPQTSADAIVDLFLQGLASR
jgi:TetR/AcrR family acrAB operon transcriptional repressor